MIKFLAKQEKSQKVIHEELELFTKILLLHYLLFSSGLVRCKRGRESIEDDPCVLVDIRKDGFQLQFSYREKSTWILQANYIKDR